MIIHQSIMPMMNGDKNIDEGMNIDTEMKSVEEKAITSSQSATLYNFGYAAKEVIENFQHFCYNYTTLGDAIYALLKRDKLLRRKYRFINTPVTYQMLARPTTHDRPNAVKSAMLAMHKYTKEGRYKSVADAIEELLLGPEQTKKFQSTGVNTNIDGYITGNECKALTPVEQDALSKIADVLIDRIQQMEKAEAEKRKRSRKSASSKKISTSQSPPQIQHMSLNKMLNDKAVTTLQKPVPAKFLDVDPDYSPSGKSKFVWTKTGGEKEKTLLHTSIVESFIEPVDIEMVTPLIQLTPKYHQPCKSRTVIRHASLSGSMLSDKSHFMINYLDLVPPSAVKLNSETTSCLINFDALDEIHGESLNSVSLAKGNELYMDTSKLQ